MFLSTVENFLASYLPNEDEEMSTAIAASLSQQENGVLSSQPSPTSSQVPAPTSSRALETSESHNTSEGSLRPWIECDYVPLLIPGDATTRILIRCLDGERRSVTFSQSQSIKELFDYLSAHGIDPTELEIVSAFPRMLLNTIEPRTSFKDANLAPSATIFIQYN